MPEKLLKRFQENLTRLSYPSINQKLVVALSGGPDSTALLHLFLASGRSPAIAHCNFGLRGKESDADAAFCREMATTLKLPYFEKSFDLGKGKGIQEAARKLRYEWFEELADEHHYDFIATAHHREDQAETLLHRFIRGTGIQGLVGIPEKRGRIIRPLLFASKGEILNYLQSQGIEYRIDSSNSAEDYTRNFIRHSIIPVSEELNPSLKQTLAERAEDYRESIELFRTGLSIETKKLKHFQKGFEGLSIRGLMKHPAGSTILFEWLSSKGFERSLIKQIYSGLPYQVGKNFESEDYRLLVQRKLLLLIPKSSAGESTVLVAGKGSYSLGNRQLKVDEIPFGKIPAKPSSNTLFLPQQEGLFPLLWRIWKKGDFFYPEGMTKSSGKAARKKLSDFFTDLKLEPVEKESQTVLEQGDKILWIPGKRKDARVKETGASEIFWRFRFSEKD
jgi:tRNA(Ile)-lysidine synthase